MHDALQCNWGPHWDFNYVQAGCFESGHSLIITSCLSHRNGSDCVTAMRVACGDSFWLGKRIGGGNLSGRSTNVNWSRNAHKMYFFLKCEWSSSCIYICLMHFACWVVKHFVLNIIFQMIIIYSFGSHIMWSDLHPHNKCRRLMTISPSSCETLNGLYTVRHVASHAWPLQN